MGDHDTMDAMRHRRPKAARLPDFGGADALRAEAEQKTTKALESLDPDAWTVVSDLEWPGGRYGHIDHVVIGPSGVYVVDTKTWSSDVSVYGGRLRYEGVTQDTVVAYLTEAAAAIALLIPAVPHRQVKPVLVVADAEAVDTNVGAMLICSPDTLVSILEARVHSMSTHQISVASDELREHLHKRGLVKAAAKAGHREAKRREFVPMRGVPVIRIAIAVWFASALILAPHAFVDTYSSVHDKVERQVEEQIDKQLEKQQP